MTLRHGELRVSDIVSALLNPSALTGVFFCLLAARYEMPGTRLIVHDVLGVAFTAVIPIGLLFLLKARGLLSDIEMSIRSERSLDFELCAAVYGLGAGLLWITGASWPLWGLLALHVPNTLVLIVANRRLKVSIHTMVLTSLSIAAVMFLGEAWLPAFLLVPAAAWARWKAGNHTVRELLWGILIGGLMTPMEILLLQALFGGR
jgi:hypothetical protein